MLTNSKNEHKRKEYNLETRLIKFTALIGELNDKVFIKAEAKNLIKQLIRSSSSAALNYGEAQVAQSIADFIHKMSICLKELKESEVALKIIQLRRLSSDMELLEKCCKECSELVAIFITSVQTARKNAGM
jgi:four helix bundle protein